MHQDKSYINLVGLCSWPEKEYTYFEGKTVEIRPTQEFAEMYGGWDKEVVDMISVCNPHDAVITCVDPPSSSAIHSASNRRFGGR